MFLSNMPGETIGIVGGVAAERPLPQMSCGLQSPTSGHVLKGNGCYKRTQT